MFKLKGTANHSSALGRTVVGAMTVGAVLIASISSSPIATATTPDATSDVRLVHDAIMLSATSGFAEISPARLTRSSPAVSVAITPTLAIELSPSKNAWTGGGATLNRTTDAVEITHAGGLAIVTDKHAHVEFRYTMIAGPGVTLIKATDGGLDEVTAGGTAIGHIDPAFAVDVTGQPSPASYSYDASTRQIIVRADTTNAHGAVLIDPSWKCYATAGGMGLLWVIAAAGWLFSDGSLTFVMWALRAWFGLSYNAANIIAKACM